MLPPHPPFFPILWEGQKDLGVTLVCLGGGTAGALPRALWALCRCSLSLMGAKPVLVSVLGRSPSLLEVGIVVFALHRPHPQQLLPGALRCRARREHPQENAITDPPFPFIFLWGTNKRRSSWKLSRNLFIYLFICLCCAACGVVCVVSSFFFFLQQWKVRGDKSRLGQEQIENPHPAIVFPMQ